MKLFLGFLILVILSMASGHAEEAIHKMENPETGLVREDGEAAAEQWVYYWLIRKFGLIKKEALIFTHIW